MVLYHISSSFAIQIDEILQLKPVFNIEMFWFNLSKISFSIIQLSLDVNYKTVKVNVGI